MPLYDQRSKEVHPDIINWNKMAIKFHNKTEYT